MTHSCNVLRTSQIPLAWEFSKLQRPNIHIRVCILPTIHCYNYRHHISSAYNVYSMHPCASKQAHSYVHHWTSSSSIVRSVQYIRVLLQWWSFRKLTTVRTELMWKHEHYVLKCLHTYVYVRGMLQEITAQEKGYRRKRSSGRARTRDICSNACVAETYSTIKHRSQVQAWSLLLSWAEICRIVVCTFVSHFTEDF